MRAHATTMNDGFFLCVCVCLNIHIFRPHRIIIRKKYRKMIVSMDEST